MAASGKTDGERSRYRSSSTKDTKKFVISEGGLTGFNPANGVSECVVS